MDLNQVLRSNVTFYFDKYLIGEPAFDATAQKTGYWVSGSLPMPRFSLTCARIVTVYKALWLALS